MDNDSGNPIMIEKYKILNSLEVVKLSLKNFLSVVIVKIINAKNFKQIQKIENFKIFQLVSNLLRFDL